MITVVALSGCNPTGSRPAASSTPTRPPGITTSTLAAPGTTSGVAAAPAISPTAPVPAGPPTPSATPATPGAPVSSGPASTPKSTTLVTPAPVTRTCTLPVRLGSAEGAAGSAYREVIFTNTAATACQLTGGAHAEYLGTDGRTVIGRSAAIDGGTVRLDPGQSVTTTMRTTATENYDEERCAAEPVSGLSITPPADAAPTTVSSPVSTACNGIIRSSPDFTPLPVAGQGP